MQPSQREAINTNNAPQPLGAYSQAVKVKAGELIYVAGQVGIDVNGNLTGDAGVAAQTRQTFANIGEILEAAGVSFNHVVEFTTYLVGRDAIAPFIEARADLFANLFPAGDYPPNTLLVVNGLVREEFFVEIKAVAARP